MEWLGGGAVLLCTLLDSQLLTLCFLDFLIYFLLFSYQRIKLQVWDGRLISPLFNTQKYTLDLEKLFYKMWRRYEQNLPPDHVVEWWVSEKYADIHNGGVELWCSHHEDVCARGANTRKSSTFFKYYRWLRAQLPIHPEREEEFNLKKSFFYLWLIETTTNGVQLNLMITMKWDNQGNEFTPASPTPTP